jgi:hypothetical protein
MLMKNAAKESPGHQQIMLTFIVTEHSFGSGPVRADSIFQSRPITPDVLEFGPELPEFVLSFRNVIRPCVSDASLHLVEGAGEET